MNAKKSEGFFRRHPASRAVKRMAGTAVLLVAAVAAVGASSSGTLALWNSSSSLGSGTITAGDEDRILIAVDSGAFARHVSLPAATYKQMMPGDVVGTTLTIKNLDANPYLLRANIGSASATDGERSFAIVNGPCMSSYDGSFPSSSSLNDTPTKQTALPALPGKGTMEVCLKTQLQPMIPSARQDGPLSPFTLSILAYRN